MKIFHWWASFFPLQTLFVCGVEMQRIFLSSRWRSYGSKPLVLKPSRQPRPLKLCPALIWRIKLWGVSSSCQGYLRNWELCKLKCIEIVLSIRRVVDFIKLVSIYLYPSLAEANLTRVSGAMFLLLSTINTSLVSSTKRIIDRLVSSFL